MCALRSCRWCSALAVATQTEIAMTISRPAVSRHLRLLKDAGMVAERAQGARRIYHLQERGIDAVQEYLQRVWGEASARFRLLAENTKASGGQGGTGEETPGS
jgi:Bacterial regulatory protein, arsR family